MLRLGFSLGGQKGLPPVSENFGFEVGVYEYRRDRGRVLSRSIPDALLDEGLADTFGLAIAAGFRVRSDDDLKRALWLMRLSALRAEDSE